jgi:hypothetical protein
VADPLIEADAVAEVDCEYDDDRESLHVGELEEVGDAVTDAVWVAEWVGLHDSVALNEPEGLEVIVCDGVPLNEVLVESDALSDAEGLSEKDIEQDNDPEAVSDNVADCV